MARPPSPRLLVLAAGLLALAAPALAQTDNPLAGPKVKPTTTTGSDSGGEMMGMAAKPTLVERDFEGRVKRLETSPEEAALAKLDLSEDERDETRALLSERAAILDRAVGNNIPLLLKLQGLKERPKSEQGAILKELAEATKELRARGPAVQELKDVMSKPNAAAFEAMVKEYVGALVDEHMEDAASRDEKVGRGPAQMRVRLELVGAEVKRSYDRRASEGLARVDAIIEAVEATPEQEAKIRAIALEFAQQTLGKPTEAQKREVFAKIFNLLEPAQREKAIKLLSPERPAGKGRGAPAKKAEPKADPK